MFKPWQRWLALATYVVLSVLDYDFIALKSSSRHCLEELFYVIAYYLDSF